MNITLLFFSRVQKYLNIKIITKLKFWKNIVRAIKKINRMVMIARDKRMDCSNHISLPLIQKYLNMKITKLKFWKNLVLNFVILIF